MYDLTGNMPLSMFVEDTKYGQGDEYEKYQMSKADEYCRCKDSSSIMSGYKEDFG